MFIHEIQSYYEPFSHAHVLKTHRYHNKIQAPFLSPFKHQKWTSRLGVASTIYSLPINCLRCRLEMHIYLSIDLINQKLTYFGANVWGRSSTPTIKAHPNWGWVVLSQLCQNTSTGKSSTLKHANISNHPHLYTNFTTFSILARYQPGPWSRSCGMVSLRNSQWEYNYQMAWLWFTCLVLMTKPLLLTKDNGWKSSTIWATIPLWAARALGSSFDQKLEGGGASGKSWGSKVDF